MSDTIREAEEHYQTCRNGGNQEDIMYAFAELEDAKRQQEVATLRARIAELESDRRIAAVLERIAKAHGILDPHQLIGMAENDDENYAEILARHVEKHIAELEGPMLVKYQPCGCVICTCDDEVQCQGCGAKMCGTHPIGENPDPVYEESESDKLRARIAELTEWRPMESHPNTRNEVLLKLEHGCCVGYWQPRHTDYGSGYMMQEGWKRQNSPALCKMLNPTGWLPLPSTKGPEA